MAATSKQPVPPTLVSTVTGEIATVVVGPSKKRHLIHKDLICHHSGYFRKAYDRQKGLWKNPDQIFTLEDVDVDVFNLFVHWLYTQDIPCNTYAEIYHMMGWNNGDQVNFKDILLKARTFGHRFLAVGFRRVVHNIYVEGCKIKAIE
ncbi:BTB domain containing protein [Pyrenophora tritici-repentis]|uniref:BTB domain containing protein n=2 Tax=Pyrenophora tritici-repentis TaxID=45151 RepID=A0A2W1D5N1_9PLEO|nr:uncharacterized protein PTRG_04324 [Pyrenophora tritici-repentis Pt-1C-BFP]KAA8619585.1 BTB domain-containing protein [Pyrenophora tritici-repentis]EDU47162.1 conserved hypothetical protein [Pyrenophora tritici-repentis Pt-1C-BFP]KAF7447730.1 BTB domain containing protein [Pyrenophora tritici-repentis]KAF7571421.1 BTB domain containing protein [Pyrenophora tritici-repentis]KAG9385342.1 BTB domain containing protein [Pyrenophora tritici-repentis]